MVMNIVEGIAQKQMSTKHAYKTISFDSEFILLLVASRV